MINSPNQPDRRVATGGDLPSATRFPSGTVSFLFTDIEGSSMLAQEFPQDISRLLEQHNHILRQSFEGHGGFIFLVTGDAFCCAFHTIREAVEAAEAHLLQQETWQPTSVRVRMGIHSGAAQYVTRPELGSAYEGYLTLVHAHRVMSSAYGGQVLLSSASAELIRGQLPDQVTLRDLGEARLKSFVQTERLWQLGAPGLQSVFPPLKSAAGTPNNLPTAPTVMIGRQAELSEIVQSLGSGQTRLFNPDGAWRYRQDPDGAPGRL